MRSRTSGRRPTSGGATWRRVRMVLAADAGIGLIETLIALVIFAIVSTALIGVLVSATSSTKTSKNQTIAEEGVASEIEMVKNWASTPDPNGSNSPTYDDIGTNPVGNPYGALPQSQVFKGVNGESLGTPAHMAISVSFASANVPGAYTNGVDYKEVAVTITRDVDGKVLSSATAFVAPPQRAAGNTATIKAQIVDYASNKGVQGAGLALGTGPSAPRSDTSDSLGNVTFQGLTPNPTSGSQAYYDLTVTPPTGYVVLSNTVSPNAAAHFQLPPSQTFPTTLYVYQPVTAGVSLLNTDGTPYTNNATVTVTTNPNRGSQTVNYTGSPLTISALSNGELLVPGVTYTINAAQSGSNSNTWANTIPTAPATYPTSLSSNLTLTMPTAKMTITVTNSKSSSPPKCAGAVVTVSGGALSSPLTGTTNSSGQVVFNDVPAASSTPLYAISATAAAPSGKTGSLSSQSLATSGSSYTVKVSGTGSTC